MNKLTPGSKVTQIDDSDLSDMLALKLPTIRRLAHRAVCPGLDYEDAVQEGMIGFFAAVGSFSADKGASFSTYANTCIQNAITQAVRGALRQKHSPLNFSIPIDDDTFTASNEGYMAADNVADTLEDIKRRLSDMECAVLTQRIAGHSYAGIAQSLSISEKAVDNALARIRSKLRNKA